MRLIDVDALVDKLSDKAKEMLGIAEQCKGQAINYYEGAKYGFAKSAIIANGLPTIDPVKHGRWIGRGNDACECSECHAVIEGDEVYWRNNYFCYHCGARMERSEEI